MSGYNRRKAAVSVFLAVLLFAAFAYGFNQSREMVLFPGNGFDVSFHSDNGEGGNTEVHTNSAGSEMIVFSYTLRKGVASPFAGIALHASDSLLDYVTDLLKFSRTAGHFAVGLSPRAGLALLRASRSRALIQGRDHVLPEDVQAVLPSVVGHRLRSRDDFGELSAEGITALFRKVPVP